MTMGDRVAVLRDGNLQQLAPPQELYDRPSNVFVASFTGSPSMNLYDASISGSTLKLGPQELALAPEHRARFADREGRVVGGSRPEHLTVASAGHGPGQGLVADVELVEALGNEQLVHFSIDASVFRYGTETSLDDETTPVEGLPAANSIARVDPGAGVSAGSRVTLNVEMARSHFFDVQTGAALA
jgi:multiple sugar transport system ATP-binding protein